MSFWPSFLYRRPPTPCVRRSLLLLLPLLHIQASPHPSSPSASAGQPQKRWLDSREAPILQPRQSRLHRWVTIKNASSLLLPLNCFRDKNHRLLRLCALVFGIVFCTCLLFLASLMCSFFMWKKYFLQPSMQYTQTHTHTDKAEMPEGSGGTSRGLIRAAVPLFVLFF